MTINEKNGKINILIKLWQTYQFNQAQQLNMDRGAFFISIHSRGRGSLRTLRKKEKTPKKSVARRLTSGGTANRRATVTSAITDGVLSARSRFSAACARQRKAAQPKAPEPIRCGPAFFAETCRRKYITPHKSKHTLCALQYNNIIQI